MIGIATLCFYFLGKEASEVELDDRATVIVESDLPRARLPDRVNLPERPSALTKPSATTIIQGETQATPKEIETASKDELREILIRVVHDESGVPVPTASIFAWVSLGHEQKLGFPRLVGKTNEAGLLLISTDVHTKKLAATAEGYVASEQFPLNTGPEMTMVLVPSQSLKVRFVDAFRRPVKPIFVRVSRFGRKLGPFHIFSSKADQSGFDDNDYRVSGHWSDGGGRIEFRGLSPGKTRLYIDGGTMVTTSGHLYLDVTLPSPPIEVVLATPMIVGFEFQAGMKVPFRIERPSLKDSGNAPSQSESEIWRKYTALWPQATFVVMPLDEPKGATLAVSYLDGEKWQVAKIPFVEASVFGEPHRIQLKSKAFRSIRLGFQMPSGKWLSDFDQFRIKEKSTGATVANGKSVDIQLMDGTYLVELTTVLAPSYGSRFEFKVDETTRSVDIALKNELWRVPVELHCDDGPRLRVKIAVTSKQFLPLGVAYVFGEKFDVWLSATGSFDLVASAPGYSSKPLTVSFKDKEWRDEAVVLKLLRTQ
jgi:hypothetical protein